METGQTLDGMATREKHERMLTLLMAGRAAEVCVLGDAAIGSGGDGKVSCLVPTRRRLCLPARVGRRSQAYSTRRPRALTGGVNGQD
jgi:hypothetical protein